MKYSRGEIQDDVVGACVSGVIQTLSAQESICQLTSIGIAIPGNPPNKYKAHITFPKEIKAYLVAITAVLTLWTNTVRLANLGRRSKTSL